MSDLLMYSYEADFVHLQKRKFKKQNKSVNLSLRNTIMRFMAYHKIRHVC